MEAPKKTRMDNLKEPWKKGDPSPNPSGRPNGQRNYATIYYEAIKKIGETRGMTPEEIEEEIERAGLIKALKGDFAFQKDIKDRIHGKPVIPVEQSGEIKIIISHD